MDYSDMISESEPISTYQTKKYTIVSRVGYLLGVPLKQYDTGILDLAEYEEMEKDVNARIIRNLSILRCAIFKHFRAINNEITYNLKNIDRMPDLISPEVITNLQEDGINIVHMNWKLTQYQTYISDMIRHKISNCRGLFPIWIEWEYIKNLFIIPKADPLKIRAACSLYQNNFDCYPYGIYLKWPDGQPQNMGNILYNDEKFVTQFLYPLNGATFDDLSKVKDISEQTRTNICDFFNARERIVIMIDCENSNPYKVYSMLQTLPQDALENIEKIVLCDDEHTTIAWKLLKKYYGNLIEYHLIQRVHPGKSLVDMHLAITACKEHMQNHVNSFVIVSSDSDFYSLVKGLPDCSFLILLEKERQSKCLIDAMEDYHIPYDFLDDFCSADIQKLQNDVLAIEMQEQLDIFELDFNELFEYALEKSQNNLSEVEKKQLKQHMLQKAYLSKTDGILKIILQ